MDLQTFLIELSEANEGNPPVMSRGSAGWIEQADAVQIAQLLEALQHEITEPNRTQDQLLANAFHNILKNPTFRTQGEELVEQMAGAIARLYVQLGASSRARHHLLQMIALSGQRLNIFADLVVEDPPADAAAALVAFAPLFQKNDYDPKALFPRLLEAIQHSHLAASVVDLANFLTRGGLVEEHPAADRRESLRGLLGELTQRLGQLEESVGAAEGDSAELAQRVEDSVALAVAVCDALALIGDREAIGKLYQAVDLRHRRLRAEAAAALATLGEEAGEEMLLQLAREPVTRLRVLTYADELGCLDKVDPEYQTPVARAESELALWLSQPTQFGIPPTQVEVVDNRWLYWPGYEEEVECFLIRFTYRMAGGEFSNIGIAGPCVHAFAADLAELPPDDIYAAFAGWQAEHDEIYELDVTQLSEAARPDVARFQRRLQDEGCSEVVPLKLGYFFGEQALIARATRDGVPGVAVAGQGSSQWHPAAGRARPINAELAYCIYKGRKLLRSFNP